MKHILLTFFAMAAISAAAQPSYQEQGSAQRMPSAQKKKVLVIPYNPDMHLSDADGEIAEYSQKNQRQVRSMLRIGMSQHMHQQLMAHFSSRNMLADMRPEMLRTLDVLYGSLEYSFDTVYPVTHPVADTSLSAKKLSLKQMQKQELQRRQKSGDVKYMNVKLSHPELLHQLAERYDAEYIVFLNQFEIKTGKNECPGMSLPVTEREYKVHYSIYKAIGEQVYGDVVAAGMTGGSNDIGEIMAKNFPTLGADVASSPPLREQPAQLVTALPVK